MTQPVQEVTDQRQVSAADFRIRQLARRPGFKPGGTALHEIKVFEDINDVVVGDDAFIWEIPEDLDGAEILRVAGFITTAGVGDTEVAIRLSPPCEEGSDILSAKIIIESGECGSKTAATQPVVIPSTTVTWGQFLHIDVDAAGTGALGLGVHVIYMPDATGSLLVEGLRGPPGGVTNWTGGWASGPAGPATAWADSVGYTAGDIVVNGGTYYRATVTHVAGALTEPGVGANWMTVWEVVTYSAGDAVSNGGTSYVATVDHTATTASEPGVGADWEDFWQILVQGHQPYSGIDVMILGNGYNLDTGVKAALPIPFDCEIIEATLLADAAGSAVVDLWLDDYGAYPPTNADSITSATPLTLSAANKTTDTALTGWTTTMSAGDVLMVNVDSVVGLSWLSVGLRVLRA